ncbi:MAG: hypothetical protein ACOVS5_03675 [Oligoflexus sp.]
MLIAILTILVVLLRVRSGTILLALTSILLGLQLGLYALSWSWSAVWLALGYGICWYGLTIALPAAWRRHGLEALPQFRLKKG